MEWTSLLGLAGYKCIIAWWAEFETETQLKESTLCRPVFLQPVHMPFAFAIARRQNSYDSTEQVVLNCFAQPTGQQRNIYGSSEL